MKTASLVSNALWVALGTAICLHAWQLRLWDAAGPGSGFLPFLAGLALALVGAALLLQERAAGAPARTEPFWSDRDSRRRVAMVVAALVALALLLPVVGFRLAAFLVLAFLLGLERHPVVAIVLAAAASAAVWWLFDAVLQVHLPGGLLGF